ncbi:MAG: carboxypeptidase-like regulatory domain-containing protein [Planctomycetes bacterium]|nr:carboxypeptidase-like regulatory domain-containing protein [Planctomycetota bacterium]
MAQTHALRAGTAALAALLLCAAGAAEQGEAPLSAERVQALVKQLGDTEYDAREEAKRQLRAMGENAREALERAQKSSEPEVAHAAAVLLHAINRATIRVKLADLKGQPIAEADVSLNLSPMQANVIGIANRRQLNATTDKDGVAVFSNLDPMHYRLQFNSTPQGFLRVYHTVEQAVKTGTTAIELTCSRGARIQGRVLSADGKPMPGVRVAAAPSVYLRHMLTRQRDLPRNLSNMQNVQADEDGRFEIKALAASDYGVIVYQEDKVLLTHSGVSVKGEDVADLKDLKVESPKDGASKTETPDAKQEPVAKSDEE